MGTAHRENINVQNNVLEVCIRGTGCAVQDTCCVPIRIYTFVPMVNEFPVCYTKEGMSKKIQQHMLSGRVLKGRIIKRERSDSLLRIEL